MPRELGRAGEVMRGRAINRHHEARMKARAEKILSRWYADIPGVVTPRDIGMSASVHCKACSCWMCGNQRRVAGPGVQERRHDDA